MANNFVTLPEIRRVARKRLSRDVWNFGAGASETETSMRRNRRALDRLAIRRGTFRLNEVIRITGPFEELSK